MYANDLRVGSNFETVLCSLCKVCSISRGQVSGNFYSLQVSKPNKCCGAASSVASPKMGAKMFDV